jgi:hypothetical protein
MTDDAAYEFFGAMGGLAQSKPAERELITGQIFSDGGG